MITISNIELVSKVCETTEVSEVNQMLERGWTLFKISDLTIDDEKYLKFVLGWTHPVSEEEFNNQAF